MKIFSKRFPVKIFVGLLIVVSGGILTSFFLKPGYTDEAGLFEYIKNPDNGLIKKQEIRDVHISI